MGTPVFELYGREQEQEFFLSFLEHSEQQNLEYREIDREVLQNYMVLPYRHDQEDSPNSRPVLADTETHQIVETLLAKLMLMTLSDKGFVSAGGVGSEDAFAGMRVARLLEKLHRKRGNFRASYVTLKDAVMFGAGMIVPVWSYREGEKTIRRVERDIFTGVELAIPTTETVVINDDIRFIATELDDIFGDPGNAEVEHWLFGARRYVVGASEAMDMVESGRWEEAAVRKAIEKPGSVTTERDDEWRKNVDRPQHSESHRLFRTMVVYEGYGDVPYRARDGKRWRRLTLLNGELVESRPNPSPIGRRVPFFEFVINPISGRFRGIAPGAVARFTQDFTNALLICLAEGVVKKTTSPVVFSDQADYAKLLAWKGPIKVQNVNNIRELQYNPPLAEAFAMLQGLKEQSRQQSGAHGGQQGLGLGTKRFSATESQLTFQAQTDRPTLMAQLLEREYFPALGHASFEMYQQFIESSTDLARRIGESYANGGSLQDIQGDYDIEFVGSSRIASREMQLQFIERAFQVFGAIPGAAPMFPWAEGMVKWLELADLRELEAMVAHPSGVEDFLTMTMLQGGANKVSGNGNGTSPSLPASGLAPAQAAGQAVA